MATGIGVNANRVRNLFVRLVELRSPLLEVGMIQRELRGWIQAQLDVEWGTDRAGEKFEGFEAGNAWFEIPATSGYEHLQCKGVEAHVDTVAVPQGMNVTPIVDGDVVRTDGSTILGADDKSGIAAIIEALLILKEQGIPHGPIQVFFTVGEERSMYGVRELNPTVIKAKSMICVDGFSPNIIWRSCAAKLKYHAIITGKEGHGAFPEKGLNAIIMAARAIEMCRQQGLIGGEDDYGVIHGESYETSVWHNVAEFVSTPDPKARRTDTFPATNVIAGEVVVTGELRAFSKKLLEETFTKISKIFDEATDAESKDGEFGGLCVITTEYPYEPFRLEENDPLVLDVSLAIERAGMKASSELIAGATHANVFSMRGVPTVVIGAGCRNPHEKTEQCVISDLVKAAEVIAHWLAV